MQGIRSKYRYYTENNNIYGRTAVVSVGVLISLNGETIPNNNKSRISVYDFDAIDQDDDISSSALRCQSELSTSDVKDTTNGCLVGAGDSPVTCEHPSQNRIATGGAGITRGWKARRIHNEDGYRALYLTRRTQTPEEGYYNCHMSGDINPLSGLYILYPSESPSFWRNERCSE